MLHCTLQGDSLTDTPPFIKKAAHECRRWREFIRGPGPDYSADDSFSLLPFQLKGCVPREWVLLGTASVLPWEESKTHLE